MSIFTKIWSFLTGWTKTKTKRSELPKLRPLTKEEHVKLGIKPSRKLYVEERLKKPSKKSRFYSNRQGQEAKLGKTKEEASLERRTKRYDYKYKKEHDYGVEYDRLNLKEYNRILDSLPEDTTVTAAFYGDAESSNMYSESRKAVWRSSEKTLAGTLRRMQLHEERELGFIDKRPIKFKLVVRYKENRDA